MGEGSAVAAQLEIRTICGLVLNVGPRVRIYTLANLCISIDDSQIGGVGWWAG